MPVRLFCGPVGPTGLVHLASLYLRDLLGVKHVMVCLDIGGTASKHQRHACHVLSGVVLTGLFGLWWIEHSPACVLLFRPCR